MATFEELEKQYPRYLFLPSHRVSAHSQLCFGCTESRHGEVVVAGRSLDTGIFPGDHETKELIVMEIACNGSCLNFLKNLRQFTIPFAQVESHEGSVEWAISRRNYERQKDLFRFYSEKYTKYGYEIKEEPFENGYSRCVHKISYPKIKDYEKEVVHFWFTDGGSSGEYLVIALLQAGINDNLTVEQQRRSLEKLK